MRSTIALSPTNLPVSHLFGCFMATNHHRRLVATERVSDDKCSSGMVVLLFPAHKSFCTEVDPKPLSIPVPMDVTLSGFVYFGSLGVHHWCPVVSHQVHATRTIFIPRRIVTPCTISS